MQPHVQGYLVHLRDTLKIFLKFILSLILHLFCPILESYTIHKYIHTVALIITVSVLIVILISLDFFSLQFYPANSLNIFEIFDHNRYDLHLFNAHTITIPLSSAVKICLFFFVNTHVTLLAPICRSRNSYVDVNSFIG